MQEGNFAGMMHLQNEDIFLINVCSITGWDIEIKCF